MPWYRYMLCMLTVAVVPLVVVHALTKQSISDLVEVDVSLDGFVFVSQTLPTIVLCAQYCIQRTICKSFNFHNVTFLCQLSDVTKVGRLDHLKSTSGVVYSDVAAWPSQVGTNVQYKGTQHMDQIH
jgi:hypothetical protein